MRKEHTVYKGKFLNIKEVDISGGNIWEYVERSNLASAVIIIPYIKDTNELVLIRQFRYPADKWVLEFPAGLRDESEDIFETAARELSEETGYDIVKIINAIPPSYSSTGLSNENIYGVTAIVEKGSKGQDLDETEQIQVLTVSIPKLISTIKEAIKHGDGIGARLMNFAYGHSFRKEIENEENK